MDVRRDTFIFYRSFLEGVEAFDDNEQLNLYRAITHYALNGIDPNLTGVAKAMFNVMKPQIDANTKKYLNGKNGGAPEGNNNNPNGRKGNKTDARTDQKPTKNQPRNNHKQTKNQTNVNNNNNKDEDDNDNDDDNDDDNINKKKNDNVKTFYNAVDVEDGFDEVQLDICNGVKFLLHSKQHKETHKETAKKMGLTLEQYTTFGNEAISEWILCKHVHKDFNDAITHLFFHIRKKAVDYYKQMGISPDPRLTEFNRYFDYITNNPKFINP